MSAPRLVGLGTGFSAFNLVKYTGNEYDFIVVSPRDHFRFTRLLPSTTVGTIGFRSIIEPVRHARKHRTVFTNSPVARVDPAALDLEDGSILPYGLLLWSTGNGPTPFALRSNLPKDDKNTFVLSDWIKGRILGRDISQF